jgi:two-component system response regulator YesN
MQRKGFFNKRFWENSAARKKLEFFSQSRRIPLRVFDRSGQELWRSRNFKIKGRFCLLLASRNGGKLCRTRRTKGAQECIRWGGPAIGVCCSSVFQITVPLMDSNRLAGSLQASPFLMTDPLQLDSGELTPLLQGTSPSGKGFRRALAAAPMMKEKEVYEAAQALFQLASEFSCPDLSCLAKVREIQDLQGKVADEIQAVKAANPDLNPSSFFKLSYDTEREIIQKIYRGEREKAKEILYKLMAIMLSQYLSDLNLLKISFLEMVVVISRAAVEAGAKAEDILGLKYQFIDELWSIENQEELCLWIIKVVENVIESIDRLRRRNWDSRFIKALDFIDQNFRSALTVGLVAREACLSPSRFSHLFTKEMGFPFLKYLTKVRIEKARTLLRDPGKSIAEVTQETGFFDQSYFTKVFKKSEGLTPKAFRKSMLKPAEK